MEKHIFTQIRLSIYTISILLIFSCNTKDQTIYPPLSGLAKLDSVQKDEINYPVAHQHLELAERAVIRPIYIETEKGKHAQHNGYQIGIKLRNLATATSYKDVKIKISYYGRNRILLNSEEITIKRTIRPLDSLLISPKITRYKETSYHVALTTATAVKN